MSESGDYDPGIWSGYSFSSARATYDVHVGRSYEDAVSTGKSKSDYLASSLTTKSSSPLVIVSDVTGSMGEWPATMFSKLPYLEHEGKEYLGKDMKISFAAVGDAYSDRYPLQVRPFTSGKGLEKRLKELIIEGNGGGQISESYDLPALYYAHNVSMPNAVNPVYIMIGDENYYDFVDKSQAKEWAGVNLQGRTATKDVFADLQKKFSVYMVRKPYDYSSSGNMTRRDQQIHESWSEILGEDHIAYLPEAGRVVDVIFGILANEMGRIEYFEEELKDRQKPGQVETVLKSLHSVHYSPKSRHESDASEGRSITRMIRDEDEIQATKSLL